MAEMVIAEKVKDEVIFRCGRCWAEVLPRLADLRDRDYPPDRYCPQCGVRVDQSRQLRPSRFYESPL